jgi:hypothetical protein
MQERGGYYTELRGMINNLLLDKSEGGGFDKGRTDDRMPPSTQPTCAATGISSSVELRYSASAPPNSKTPNVPAPCLQQFFADLSDGSS